MQMSSCAKAQHCWRVLMCGRPYVQSTGGLQADAAMQAGMRHVCMRWGNAGQHSWLNPCRESQSHTQQPLGSSTCTASVQAGRPCMGAR